MLKNLRTERYKHINDRHEPVYTNVNYMQKRKEKTKKIEKERRERMKEKGLKKKRESILFSENRHGEMCSNYIIFKCSSGMSFLI